MRPECCASRDVQLSDDVGGCELSFLFGRERTRRNDIGEGWGKVRPGSATDCRRDASPLGCTAPGCAISVGLWVWGRGRRKRAGWGRGRMVEGSFNQGVCTTWASGR